MKTQPSFWSVATVNSHQSSFWSGMILLSDCSSLTCLTLVLRVSSIPGTGIVGRCKTGGYSSERSCDPSYNSSHKNIHGTSSSSLTVLKRFSHLISGDYCDLILSKIVRVCRHGLPVSLYFVVIMSSGTPALDCLKRKSSATAVQCAGTWLSCCRC